LGSTLLFIEEGYKRSPILVGYHADLRTQAEKAQGKITIKVCVENSSPYLSLNDFVLCSLRGDSQTTEVRAENGSAGG
jgi:hypothetical protein